MSLMNLKHPLPVAIGCTALLMSCQLDSEPRRDGSSAGRAGSSWMPRSAGETGMRSGAANTGVSMSMPTAMLEDAGVPRAVERVDASATQPLPPQDAGVTAPTREGRDAAAAQPRDAATPPEPAPDAAPPVRDASPPQQPTADTSPTVLCEPGTYTGTFSGQIDAAGAALSNVTGSVRAQLVPDVTTLYLLISDARVMGLDQDGNTLTASLSGSINCITGLIEEGRLDSGVFHVAEAAADLTFIGAIEGVYANDQQTLLGTWSGEADASSLIAGRGAFTLVASP